MEIDTNLERHRGVGQTQNLIDNLPNERCAIVVPKHDIGKSILKRIEEQYGKQFVKNIKVFSISSPNDAHKMSGYGHSVFFDNSFLLNVDKETAITAYRFARGCAIVKEHGNSK